MAKIKIDDLPKDVKLSREDMRRLRGGVLGTGARLVTAGGRASSFIGDELGVSPASSFIGDELGVKGRPASQMA